MKSKTNLWKWAREMKRLYGDGFVMECFFSDHYLFVLNGSEFVDPVLARVITATDTFTEKRVLA